MIYRKDFIDGIMKYNADNGPAGLYPDGQCWEDVARLGDQGERLGTTGEVLYCYVGVKWTNEAGYRNITPQNVKRKGHSIKLILMPNCKDCM